MKHPDLGSLPAQTRDLVGHLLACPLCRARALRHHPGERALTAAARDLAALEYSALWPHLEAERARDVQRVAAEREQAAPLLDELLSLPEQERRERGVNDPRFRSYPLARKLIELTLTPPAGESGVPFGRLALDIAHALAGSRPAKPLLLSDLAAAAHGALGEALRRMGALGAAEAALLEAARELTVAILVDNDTRPFFCQTLASLRRDQNRLDEALALFGHAAELWRDLGFGEAEASAWLEQGELALLEALDPARALAAFDTAATVPGLSGRLAFLAFSGVLRSLAALDRPEEALHLLVLRKELHRFAPGSYEALELSALEGRLERQRGRLGLARRRLTEAFRGLLRSTAFPEAVQAGVELLRTLLLDRQGREKLPQVTAEILALARTDKLAPEVREAVLFCLERKVDSRFPRLLRSLAEYLERSRLRPRLSFRGEDRDDEPPTAG